MEHKGIKFGLLLIFHSLSYPIAYNFYLFVSGAYYFVSYTDAFYSKSWLMLFRIPITAVFYLREVMNYIAATLEE